MSSEEDNEVGRNQRGRGGRGQIVRGRGMQRGYRRGYEINRGDEYNSNNRQEDNSEQEHEEESYHNSSSSSRGRGRGRGRNSQLGITTAQRNEDNNEDQNEEDNDNNSNSNNRGRGKDRKRGRGREKYSQNIAQRNEDNKEDQSKEDSYHNSSSSSRGRGRGRGRNSQLSITTAQRNESNNEDQNEEEIYNNSSSSNRGRGRGRNGQNIAQRNESNRDKIVYENINNYPDNNSNNNQLNNQQIENNNNVINNNGKFNRKHHGNYNNRGQAPSHRGRGRDTRPQEERDQDPPELPRMKYRPPSIPQNKTKTFNAVLQMKNKDIIELSMSYLREIFTTFFSIQEPILLQTKDIGQMRELCDPIFHIFDYIKSLFPRLNQNIFIFIFLQLSKLNIRFSPLEFLNLCYVIDSLLHHFLYLNHLKSKDRFTKRSYVNNPFEQFLLKKSKYLYFYNEYLIEEFVSHDYLISIQKRRPLDIDDNLFFNYIPQLCPNIENNHNCRYGELCMYSHTLNEILYHPLVYKKIPCPLQDECDKENCPKYHSFLDIDYVINLKTDEIISTICEYISAVCLNQIKANDDNFEKQQMYLNSFIDLEKDPTQSFTNSIPSEYLIEQLPSEFNPKTYKTKLCPFGKLCKLDVKLCLCYHDEFDKRRDTNNYKYSHEICPSKVDENGINPSSFCPKENTCEYAHNVYEHMYHPIIFRTNECPNENDCKYYLICPFEHAGQEILPLNEDDNDEENAEQVLGNSDVIKNYYVHKLEKFKESQKEYLDKLKKKVKNFCCGECTGEQNILKGQRLNLKKISQTNHILLCNYCSDQSGVIKIDMKPEENNKNEK